MARNTLSRDACVLAQCDGMQRRGTPVCWLCEMAVWEACTAGAHITPQLVSAWSNHAEARVHRGVGRWLLCLRCCVLGHAQVCTTAIHLFEQIRKGERVTRIHVISAGRTAKRVLPIPTTRAHWNGELDARAMVFDYLRAEAGSRQRGGVYMYSHVRRALYLGGLASHCCLRIRENASEGTHTRSGAHACS
jgi:hypothetical protein